MFSVQGYNAEKKGWRLLGHLPTLVAMGNVHFLVNENARKRVIKEKHKTVHAFVACDDIMYPTESLNLRADSMHETLTNFSGLSYNPYKGSKFYINGDPNQKVEACGGEVLLISTSVEGVARTSMFAESPILVKEEISLQK